MKNKITGQLQLNEHEIEFRLNKYKKKGCSSAFVQRRLFNLSKKEWLDALPELITLLKEDFNSIGDNSIVNVFKHYEGFKLHYIFDALGSDKVFFRLFCIARDMIANDKEFFDQNASYGNTVFFKYLKHYMIDNFFPLIKTGGKNSALHADILDKIFKNYKIENIDELIMLHVDKNFGCKDIDSVAGLKDDKHRKIYAKLSRKVYKRIALFVYKYIYTITRPVIDTKATLYYSPEPNEYLPELSMKHTIVFSDGTEAYPINLYCPEAPNDRIPALRRYGDHLTPYFIVRDRMKNNEDPIKMQGDREEFLKSTFEKERVRMESLRF